jgi:succinoglycan biosynthesis protein ExoU
MLDADDYFLPQRISRLLGAADPASWDMIADDILIVPEGLQHHEFRVSNSNPVHPCKTLDLESFVRGNISHPRRPRGELGFLKPIISRSLLHRHALRYDESLKLGEDYALYTSALIAGARFCLAGACGYVAVERGSSISSRHSAMDLERIAAFDAECLKRATQLTDQDRAALAAHHRATTHKYTYRRILDRKRDLGLLPALALLVATPASIPYIASETLKAKAGKLLKLENRGPADPATSGLRFLIGMPNTRLTLGQTE